MVGESPRVPKVRMEYTGNPSNWRGRTPKSSGPRSNAQFSNWDEPDQGGEA